MTDILDNKPKPIVVIRISNEDFGTRDSAKERYSLIGWLNKNKPDYYWFVLPQDGYLPVDFEVYYEKDHQPISNDELKKLIQDAIKIPDLSTGEVNQ